MTARARGPLVGFGLVAAATIALAASFPLQWWNFSSAYLAERYTRPQSRFMDVAGTRIHYQDEGWRDGPAIVLLHNDKGNLRIFDAWVPILGDRYRVIRLDLPGYGLTGEVANGDYSLEHDGEVIDELTRRLAVGRFALVATSLPAASAFRFAARFPERVTALVLANAGGLPRLPNQKLNVPPPDPLRRWIYRYYLPRAVFAEGVQRAFHDVSRIPPGFVDQIYELTNRRYRNRENARRFESYLPSPPTAAAALNRVKAPVLLLWGRYSELDPSEADRFEMLLTSAAFVEKKIYEDVGHALFVETGARAAQDVGRFVGKSVPGEPVVIGSSAPRAVRPDSSRARPRE